MINVRFYYKEGCSLCIAAEEMLNGLEEKYQLDIEKIDITSDDEIYELYRYDVPVIELEDGSVFHGRIKRKEILQRLNELKNKKTD
ncbi:MAG: glutaredoxin family protein [Nitrospirae bacterium]|nr:glutaredoxin family protein [Nitrospirota bacterium]